MKSIIPSRYICLSLIGCYCLNVALTRCWLLLIRTCPPHPDSSCPRSVQEYCSSVLTAILITTMRTAIFISLLCLDLSMAQVLEGLLPLDMISFDKVVSKFEYSLIKFDTGYPTGDKHKTFGKLAVEVCKYMRIYGTIQTLSDVHNLNIEVIDCV